MSTPPHEPPHNYGRRGRWNSEIKRLRDENLELRAELERALILLDRLAEYAHGEDCDTYNACENSESDTCYFDEEKDERVHDHTSCDCLVWDAAQKAKDIRLVLKETLGRRSPQDPSKEK